MNQVQFDLKSKKLKLNGADIECLKSYHIRSLDESEVVELTLTLDAEIVNHNKNEAAKK